MPPDYVRRSLWSSLPRDLVVGLPLIWCGYIFVTEQGPWLWLAEAQLWLFNAYFPSYTFAGCMMVGVGGSVLFSVVLDRAGWRRQSLSVRGVSWVLGLPGWLCIPFGIGMVLLVIALWHYVPMQLAGPRTEVRADELEAGAKPESRWLVIQGQAPPGLFVEWKEKGKVKHIDACFVSPDWQIPQPVAVVLKKNAEAQLPAQPVQNTIEGTASALGVPGLTRSALEARGVKIAADAVYIEVGQTPENSGPRDFVFMAVGAGVMTLVVLIGNIREAWQRPSKVISTAWRIGESVAVQWQHDGYYYAGVILEAKSPNYQIHFEDGERAWVSDEQLAVLALQAGTRVEARWRNGPDYYPGAITQFDGPRLHIRYDNGDEEWTTLSMIRFAF